jgi:prepilin-type N-terminal cleavage/methylation domain-containing protein
VPGPGRRRRQGFTLIEIMTVLLILGVILMSVVPAIDGLVPSYRLKGAAREVAALLEMAQSEAISQRKEFRVAYDLDRNTYWLVLPPKDREEEDGETDPTALAAAQADQPIDDIEHGQAPVDPDAEQDTSGAQTNAEREALAPKDLPTNVVFEAVIVGDDEKQSGEVMVPFERLGTAGSHVVGLKLENDENNTQLWVKFNALTRTIEYYDEKPTVRTLSGSGQ